MGAFSLREPKNPSFRLSLGGGESVNVQFAKYQSSWVLRVRISGFRAEGLRRCFCLKSLGLRSGSSARVEDFLLGGSSVAWLDTK